MFNFIHPKPVVSRRPVAEHSVKQAARVAALPSVLTISTIPHVEPSTAATQTPSTLEAPVDKPTPSF